MYNFKKVECSSRTLHFHSKIEYAEFLVHWGCYEYKFGNKIQAAKCFHKYFSCAWNICETKTYTARNTAKPTF